jgi:hypothetical protein
MKRSVGAVLIGSLFAVVSAGCGAKPTLRVTDIQLGRSLNADNSVREHATAFTPKESIYLAVLTEGKGSATLTVRWSLGTRVLDEPKKQVSYGDAAATDFGLKTGWGFPVGQYTAEVFMDGQPVGSRKFRVEEKR